ncbi:MAG: AAA family ATPase [Candidatus Eremiobacteraeota bacterium]|nr:AAA family ATPase [Candidatus Eremiobacteraeota bacterium]
MIEKVLPLDAASATRVFSELIATKHPDSGIVEGYAWGFDPFGYAASGACAITPLDDEYLHVQTAWDGTHGVDTPANGAFDVRWQGHGIRLYWCTLQESGPYFVLVADRRSDAMAFFEAAARWSEAPAEQILVFHAGRWAKDERLFASIRDATFDNLVMTEAEKLEIATDAERFFGSRARYERYGVPWKRGVLFAGPPGNGKTHAVKAIVNHATVPSVYVRSFDLPGHPFPGAGIAMVFERARRIAPCIVVLEDLDALIRDDNRAYFLNELDGFERNDGILVLATTNHPERIDAAIIDRPSRFDRKYAFGLPAPELRAAYIRQWNAELEPELRLTDEDVDAVAGATDGFSYAYLKELFVSSLMRWVGDETIGFAARLQEHVPALRLQIGSEAQAPLDMPAPDGIGFSFPVPAHRAAFFRAMRWGG